MDNIKLEKGINVLVPTYKAEKFILKFLDSMKKQTLSYDLFEVLFVINGERDNTESLINGFSEKNPEINIKVIESEPGATTARNKGIDFLNREYVIFVDVDDFISPGYLKIALEHSAPNRIVIGNYFDIDENTGEISETYFTSSLQKFTGLINPYDVAQGAILIATNKLMPTACVKNVKFNPDLKSGDDHVYFCKLYAKYDFEFYVVDNDEDATYYRVVVSNSVSRQGLSYDFNIIQRLDVMKEIDQIYDNLTNPKMEKLLYLTINSSQMTFIERYLEKYPQDYRKVLDEIKKYNLNHFNYNVFKDKSINILLKKINEINKELKDLSDKNKILNKSNSILKEHCDNGDKLTHPSKYMTVSIEELDKQFEFYNKSFNQFEKLNHDYTLKINSLQKQVNEKNSLVNEKIKLTNEKNSLLDENKKLINQNNNLIAENNRFIQKNKYYEALLNTKIYKVASHFRNFVDKIKLLLKN